MVEDPIKLGYPDWGRGSIGEDDWIAIKTIMDFCNVKTVLEIGIGLSTLLLMQNCEKLDGYDTLGRHLEWMKTKVNGNVTLTKWDGKTPMEIKNHYDMAFIDGPTGAKLRKPSFKSAYGHCKVLAIHDCGYIWNDVWRFEIDPEEKYKVIWPGGRFSAWVMR